MGKKNLLPAPALGAVGPVNCAAQASVCALRVSEALTVPSRHALGTVVAGESVAKAVASARTDMLGRTVGKVRGQPSIYWGKERGSKNRRNWNT